MRDGMRRTAGFASVLVGIGAALASAEATIDTGGATLETGEAPVRGAVIVDHAAELGNAPAIAPDEYPYGNGRVELQFYDYAYQRVVVPHRGLGGQDLVVDADLTLPAGTYDFASLEVTEGTTLRFTGPSTVRLTGGFHLEGQVVLEESGELQIETRGAITVLGRAGEVETGIVAESGYSTIRIVGASVDVLAEAGAQVRFRADGDDSRVLIGADAGPLTLRDTSIDAWPSLASATSYWIYAPESIVASSGPLTLERTTSSAGRLWLTAGAPEGQDAVTIREGSYANLLVQSHRGSVVLQRTDVDATDEIGIFVDGGGISVLDDTSIVSERAVRLMCTGDLRIGAGCVVSDTDLAPNHPGVWVENTRYPYLVLRSVRGAVEIASDALLDHVADDRFLVGAASGITIRGTIRTNGLRNEIYTAEGDIEIGAEADISAPDAALRVWAGGAVFAQGGTARLSAPEYDVRCITGDLDLNVDLLEATEGRIVALSNGLVRLRGTYRAARDIQVLSVLDSVDVRGATLETYDVGNTLSGFVRLATYAPWAYVEPIPADGEDDWSDEDDEDDEDESAKAATAIGPDGVLRVTLDASDATLRTGSSAARSGDVLVQVAESSASGSQVAMKSLRVRARKAQGGMVRTEIVGSMRHREWLGHDGTTRITAGAVSRRVFLENGRGAATTPSGTVEIQLTRTTVRRTKFKVSVTEASAPRGAQARFGFDRAGVHARTMFRRPRVR